MRRQEVKIGGIYFAKMPGRTVIVPVRIDSELFYGGWNATNLDTGRSVLIPSAACLLREWEDREQALIEAGFERVSDGQRANNMAVNMLGLELDRAKMGK